MPRKPRDPLKLNPVGAAFVEKNPAKIREIVEKAVNRYGRTLRPVDIDDVFQETCLRVATAKRLDERTIPGYAFTIAKNIIWQGLEKSSRAPSLSDLQSKWLRSPELPDVRGKLEDEYDFLRRAKKVLSERQMQVLILRYAGLSHKEIAQRFDITPAGVNGHLKSIKKMLRSKTINLQRRGSRRK